MINNISSSNPANTAPLSLQAPASSNSDINVQYLVAKALADAFKTNTKAQPSDKEQLLEAIEQAIANAAAANGSYDSATQFWKNFANTLPAGSPLKEFATAQWHILVDNPHLEQWQKQLKQDQISSASAVNEDKQMQQTINAFQQMINYCQAHWYNPGCLVLLAALYPEIGSAMLVKKAYDAITLAPAEARVQSDQGILAKLEQNVLKHSAAVDQQFSQAAGEGLDEGKSEQANLKSMLEQFVGLQKVLIKMDQIQS